MVHVNHVAVVVAAVAVLVLGWLSPTYSRASRSSSASAAA
jgi:hypothetical protein